MKTYQFEEPDRGGHIVVTNITEDQILEDYFDYWSIKMVKVGKSSLISKQHCIKDFCVIHGAWEIDSNVQAD